MIVARALQKRFTDGQQDIVILKDLDFCLEAGASVALMGESGAGKTTLLHMLGGFIPADAGTIHINDHCITTMSDSAMSRFRRRNLGMVFQQFNLIESLNALDNITFTRRLLGLPAENDTLRSLIALLRLDQRLSHLPSQLSGGERQRVAIARALACEPGVVFADEPTGNLDETTANTVMQQLMDAVTLTGATLLLVTHSQRTAAYLQKIWRLEKGHLHC